jgi:hypothetical protein
MLSPKKIAFLEAISTLFIIYFAGFYLVVFGFRCESNDIRFLTLKIDDLLYQPVISLVDESSIIRRIAYHRVKWLCEGYDKRCNTED